MENKDTPISLTPHGVADESHDPIFPEAVTNALTAWISSQSTPSGVQQGPVAGVSSSATPLLSPPPSTPMEGDTTQNEPATIRHAISASDLITALSTLIPSSSRHESLETSEESSRVCSVPACTPKDGTLSEWIKLGIHPEEVIQALSALTMGKGEEGESEGREKERDSTQAEVRGNEREGERETVSEDNQTLSIAQAFSTPEVMVEKPVYLDPSSITKPDNLVISDDSDLEESDSVFSTPPPPPESELLGFHGNKSETNKLSDSTGIQQTQTSVNEVPESISQAPLGLTSPPPPILVSAYDDSIPNTCPPPTTTEDTSVAPNNDDDDGGIKERGEGSECDDSTIEDRAQSPIDNVLYAENN